jgi:hypothetical protein
LAKFVHRPSKRELAFAVEFSKPLTGTHVLNELASISIDPDGVRCRITAGLPEVYCGRIEALLPILIPYLETCELDGEFDVSLGDQGLNSRVLSFCSIIPDFLIPDPYFIHSGGYANERRTFAPPPWAERRDELYWRGADTGVWRYREVWQSPRVAICALANAHPGLIDAKITRIEPSAHEAAKQAYYAESSLTGPEADQAEILNYRYQIDIDGNTSTWSGFFLKLLTGSPVLKVESECCWRQWYYDRLEAGKHYLSVKADLSDLLEKLAWLRANPFGAQQIGLAGRAFALSLDFDWEVQQGTATLARLVSLNRRIQF